MIFPDFSLTFPVCSKFPDFSLTGKCLPIFPGFPGFPVQVGTLLKFSGNYYKYCSCMGVTHYSWPLHTTQWEVKHLHDPILGLPLDCIHRTASSQWQHYSPSCCHCCQSEWSLKSILAAGFPFTSYFCSTIMVPVKARKLWGWQLGEQDVTKSSPTIGHMTSANLCTIIGIHNVHTANIYPSHCLSLLCHVFLMPQIEIEIPASDWDKEYSRYLNWLHSFSLVPSVLVTGKSAFSRNRSEA